jgi:hypothetical protein
VWIQAPDCAACTCSLARAEDSSPTSSSAMSPCVPSNSTPTVSGCCSPDRPMAHCPGSPCGITCARLTAPPGADTSISSAPAFPASPGVSPGNGRASRTRGISGLTPIASFARYDLGTSSWKMSQISLFTTTLEPYSGTWPAHGMMRSGQCWELATWVLPTAGNASGYSWPTPRAIYGEHPGMQDPRHLTGAVQMWPTPNVPNGGRTTWHAEQVGLEQAVRIWATPSARDWRSGKASPETMEKNARPLSEQVGGQLNPTWVCWLMGWPLDWTGTGPLNPQTSRAWRQVFRTALTAYVPSAMARCRCAPPLPGAC